MTDGRRRISRGEAIRIAREIMERAERQRIECAELEAREDQSMTPKPCPICGSEMEITEKATEWWMRCVGICRYSIALHVEEKDEAIEVWNTLVGDES